MESILQILKLNDVRKGVGKASGNPYEMQDAECLLLDEVGNPVEVGVLMIPKDMMGKVSPGVFLGSFALRASKAKDAGRRIEAVLTGLRPIAHPKAPAQKGA